LTIAAQNSFASLSSPLLTSIWTMTFVWKTWTLQESFCVVIIPSQPPSSMKSSFCPSWFCAIIARIAGSLSIWTMPRCASISCGEFESMTLTSGPFSSPFFV